MNNTKLKKQLSLVVFLPFLFVSTYNTSQTYDININPLYFITSIILEDEVQYSYNIKKIKSVKNFINNLINYKKLKKVFTTIFKIKSFSSTIMKVVVGESAIVQNRGSPVVC